MGLNQLYWRLQKDESTGLEFIILGVEESLFGGRLEAWILPSKGSNLCRLTVGDKNIIDFDSKQLNSSWFFGTPVLYPTPNRVMEGTFRFNGIQYPQVKRGEKVLIHGLVHDEEWKWSEPQVILDSIVLNTWIDFDENSSMFEAFPFEHRLLLEFSLNAKGISITYSIENRDGKALPFGIAFHPYFRKLSGENETLISVPAEDITECMPEYMPTGRFIKVEGTKYDLLKPVSVGDRLGIDNNYVNIRTGQKAEIFYKPLNMTVQLDTSEEFSHIVVYTPDGSEFFCIENQTCSINAHNFYDAGFKKESGLLLVPAGTRHTGYVKYLVKACEPSVTA